VKITWSPLALERAREIARYISQDNPNAAARWIEDLFDTVQRLSAYPESGRVVPEVGIARIREVIFGAYRVIYSVKAEIEILTIRRGSQIIEECEAALRELSQGQETVQHVDPTDEVRAEP
jgi:addiction module RelE/StbE family toxin